METIIRKTAVIARSAIKGALALLLVLMSTSMYADVVKIGELYYNIVEKASIAEVTSVEGEPYTFLDISIPESVIYNGKTYRVIGVKPRAFYRTPLETVSLPKTLERIESEAFATSHLKRISLSGPIPTIGSKAFYGVTWVSVYFDDMATWQSLVNALECKSVRLFLKGEEITELRIPEGTITISDNAFRGCQNLTSVIIPEGVTTIGKHAFFGCEGLTSLTLPNSLTTIMESAFEGCANLPAITIPGSVNEIGRRAFVGLKSITSLTIPDGVTTIAESLCVNCYSLSQVSLPSSVVAIGDNAFKDCIGLTSLRLPAKLETMGNEVFIGCTNLTEIILPIGLSSIVDGAFRRCSSLSRIEIPNTVTSIGKEAFAGCSQLKDLQLPNSLTLIGQQAFQGCDALTSITIPSGVRVIGNAAFLGSALTSVTISEGVKTISGYAFYECSNLRTVTIGKNVNVIQQQAFGKCPELTVVHCLAEEMPQTSPDAFDGSYTEYASLVVPESSMNSYQTTNPWSDFGEIKAATNGINMAYRPFVEDNKVWIVEVNSDNASHDRWTVFFYFEGDTIINGQKAKRLLYDRVDSVQSTIGEYFGAWYEQDKKVYAAYDKQFELVYDFTLSSGDSISISDYMKYVVNKLSGDISGFKGTYYDFLYNGTVMDRWFEGVGNTFFPYRYGLTGHTSTLLACTVGDEVIYDNSEGGYPYVMGSRKQRIDFTHTVKTKPKSRITRGEALQPLYGEYNDQQLGINLNALDDAYQVRITDETGKVVYEKAVDTGNIVGLNIDISSYAKGRYTVILDNRLESFTGEFETQTTGITDNVKKVSCNSESIFNLQGQRISSLRKGLNIVKGRKLFVK
jgi:hypothetical protein